MNFPPELIEQIIVAAQEDTRCLRACGLTCGLFYSISSKYLFRHVYVCALPINNAEKLHAVLETSPHLRLLIHSITVECSRCWIYPAAFSNIFSSKFPGLERLNIVGASWKIFPKDAKDAILSALRTNDLQCLNLTSMQDFPFSKLRECQSLRELALVKSSYDEEDLLNEDLLSVSKRVLAIETPMQLKSLRLAPYPVAPQVITMLRKSLNWFKSSTCPFSISRLQNLSLRTSDLTEGIPLFNELFRFVDPLSLKWLNLDVRHDGKLKLYDFISKLT